MSTTHTDKKPVHKKPAPRKRTVGTAVKKPKVDSKPSITQAPVAETHSEPAAPKQHKNSGKFFYGIGRRKTAMAKVRIFPEAGVIEVNHKPIEKYFGNSGLIKVALTPLELLGLKGLVGITAYVSGGGIYAQSQALRHGIARALILRNPEDKPTLKKSGLLTRDPRVKERKKPGLKRARRGPQWAKR